VTDELWPWEPTLRAYVDDLRSTDGEDRRVLGTDQVDAVVVFLRRAREAVCMRENLAHGPTETAVGVLSALELAPSEPLATSLLLGGREALFRGVACFHGVVAVDWDLEVDPPLVELRVEDLLPLSDVGSVHKRRRDLEDAPFTVFRHVFHPL
jgi:hypothetical protein